MKLILLALLTFASTCLADDPAEKPAQVPLPEIRNEHRDMRDKDGQVFGSVETVYRGKDRLLETIRYKIARGEYAAGGWFRIYRVGGEPVLLEEDKNGDGNADIIAYGKGSNLEVFEAFKRQSNASVEPVSSEEFVKLKLQAAVASAMAEDVAGRIEKSITNHNTAEEVMDDLQETG